MSKAFTDLFVAFGKACVHMNEAKLLSATELREQGQEVKPCPFCGEKDDLQHHDDGQTWPTMECCYCGCSMRADEDYSALYYWNRRVSEGGWVRLTGDRLQSSP